MTIREEVNRQIKHIESQIVNMEGFNPHKTKESINAMYWCGRQAVTTTLDFVDTLQSIGVLTEEESKEFTKRIRKLYTLLEKTHNALI